jgi:hypothetical protein
VANIPPIVTGLFDIFVPGTFLLANLVLVLYLVPGLDKQTEDFIKAISGTPALVVICAILFGYLTGVLLRMLRTEHADRWSAAWLRAFHPHAVHSGSKRWGKNAKLALFLEEFPYIAWIGRLCKRYLPDNAKAFYASKWAPMTDPDRPRQNRQFLNYCKVLIISEDERLAKEMNASEALSRYIAAMCYALLISIVLIIGVGIANYVSGQGLIIGLVVLLVLYLTAIVVILANFRFVRIKEVEIVFAACVKHKQLFN